MRLITADGDGRARSARAALALAMAASVLAAGCSSHPQGSHSSTTGASTGMNGAPGELPSTAATQISREYTTGFDLTHGGTDEKVATYEDGNSFRELVSSILGNPLASNTGVPGVVSATTQAKDQCTKQRLSYPCAVVIFNLRGSENQNSSSVPQQGYAVYKFGNWLIAKRTVSSVFNTLASVALGILKLGEPPAFPPSADSAPEDTGGMTLAQAKEQIQVDYSTIFDVADKSIGPKAADVEDGQSIAKAMSDADNSLVADDVGGATVSSITVGTAAQCQAQSLSHPCASVSYQVLGALGQTFSSQNSHGFAVVQNGKWVVAKRTACQSIDIVAEDDQAFVIIAKGDDVPSPDQLTAKFPGC